MIPPPPSCTLYDSLLFSNLVANQCCLGSNLRLNILIYGRACAVMISELAVLVLLEVSPSLLLGLLLLGHQSP
jgi:hypothetical protein